MDTVLIARGGISVAPLTVVNSTSGGKADVVFQSVAYLAVGTGDHGAGCGEIGGLGEVTVVDEILAFA